MTIAKVSTSLKKMWFLLCCTCFMMCQSEKGNDISKTEISLVFPKDYVGIYSGTLKITNDSKEQNVPMTFKLVETDTIGRFNYTLIYGEGDTYQERKYTLLEKNAKKGVYIVDENNGIILDDKWVGTTLYSLFEVQGNILTTFITFKSDHLIFEIVFANKSNKKTTTSEGENSIEVISYPISVVQKAILQKQ